MLGFAITAYFFEHRPATADEVEAAKGCIREYAADLGIVSDHWIGEPFCVFARGNENEKLIGGLIGRIHGSWLYVDLVWVEKPFRGSGIGRNVMIEAERRARERGLTGIYLWTESWEAPDLYSKLGLEKFVEFENFPPGHRRIGFRKYL